MIFSIDEKKYRVIDLSLRMDPPGTKGRPLIARRDRLADGLWMNHIETHTHVGTHVESPAHFKEGLPGLEDFPLESFFGRAVLFEFSGINCEPVDGKVFEKSIGQIMRPGDIVVSRNNHSDWRKARDRKEENLPYLTPDGARWLVAHKAKLFVVHEFTGIRPSADPGETSRVIHEIMMAGGTRVLLLEYASGLENITRKEFFFMALPVRFAGVDSMWTRAIAIEER